MNHPKQRSRGRGNPNLGSKPRHMGGGRNQMFDSNGPDGRIRGTAQQVMERYLALARDASSQDDRVTAENCYQHAEHYLRLLNAYNQNNPPPPPRRPFPNEQPEFGEAGEQSDHVEDTEADASADDAQQEEPVAEAV